MSNMNDVQAKKIAMIRDKYSLNMGFGFGE